MWSDWLLDLGTYFLVGNMVFVRDVWYLAVAPHLSATVIIIISYYDSTNIAPEGRPGMSDVSPLSGISGLSFDSTLLSLLLFFCLVLLPFLSYLFLPAGPFF